MALLVLEAIASEIDRVGGVVAAVSSEYGIVDVALHDFVRDQRGSLTAVSTSSIGPVVTSRFSLALESLMCVV